MKGPFWVKQWIADMAVLNEEFRREDGTIDLAALGKEEYEFRSALIRRQFSSSERAKKTFEEAASLYDKMSQRGSKGGRPRLDASTKQATEQQPVVKPRPLKPPSVQQLYDFCADNSIDEAYAREWYEMCSDRQWKDRAMKPIENWKGALVNYVKNKQAV